jgi:hypothetical protein
VSSPVKAILEYALVAALAVLVFLTLAGEGGLGVRSTLAAIARQLLPGW